MRLLVDDSGAIEDINEELLFRNMYPPTLKHGAHGEWIEKLQTTLNYKDGVDLKVDGIFGQKTLDEVRNFQLRYGLVDDGIVGPKTWEQLGY